MKRLLLTLSLFLLNSPLFSATEFGKKVDTSKITPISKLLANAEKFKEQNVTIKGMITNVCSRRGCWMEFASDKKYQTLRIKVHDGDMVFPLSAKGKMAYATGKIHYQTFSKKDLIAMEKKFAKRQKRKAHLEAITGPKTFYQFTPLGVRIE